MAGTHPLVAGRVYPSKSRKIVCVDVGRLLNAGTVRLATACELCAFGGSWVGIDAGGATGAGSMT